MGLNLCSVEGCYLESLRCVLDLFLELMGDELSLVVVYGVLQGFVNVGFPIILLCCEVKPCLQVVERCGLRGVRVVVCL